MSGSVQWLHPFANSAWRIGLGTYHIGAGVEQLVSQAFKVGWRHIDTAALYRNEQAVGAAIKASGIPRSEIFVTTKIQLRDISRLRIRQAVELSLAKLGQIDLMLLHNWCPQAAEAWDLLADEATKGRVGSIGVSNFGIADLAGLSGPKPVVNQIEMSPFLQRQPLRQKMAELGIATVAHSSLTKGHHLGTVKALIASTSGAHSKVTAAQVMLAWSIASGAVPLVRSRHISHLAENIVALEMPLGVDLFDCLNAQESGYATHPAAMRG